MITYKNISYSAKTFYGVKFGSGEIKQVPGYINDPSMIRIFGYVAEPVSETPTPRRRRKATATEQEVIAEPETTIEITQEETTDGN